MPDETLQSPQPEPNLPPDKPERAPGAVEPEPVMVNKKSMRSYLRFDRFERVEHWIFMASFTTLGITGLAQKFSMNPVAIWLLKILGGIENARLIHHVAATIMLLVVIYHIGAVGYRIYARLKERSHA